MLFSFLRTSSIVNFPAVDIPVGAVAGASAIKLGSGITGIYTGICSCMYPLSHAHIHDAPEVSFG